MTPLPIDRVRVEILSPTITGIMSVAHKVASMHQHAAQFISQPLPVAARLHLAFIEQDMRWHGQRQVVGHELIGFEHLTAFKQEPLQMEDEVKRSLAHQLRFARSPSAILDVVLHTKLALQCLMHTPNPSILNVQRDREERLIRYRRFGAFALATDHLVIFAAKKRADQRPLHSQSVRHTRFSVHVLGHQRPSPLVICCLVRQSAAMIAVIAVIALFGVFALSVASRGQIGARRHRGGGGSIGISMLGVPRHFIV